jgi:hypothetical protein
MKEPKRWSDPAGGADAETRAMLQQAPQVGPSHGEVNRMWAALAPRLDIAYPPPAPPQGQPGMPRHGLQAAAAAGTGALAAKVTLAVVLATAVGAVGVRAISSRDRHVTEPSTTDHRPSLPQVRPIPPEPASPPASAPAVPAVAPRENRSRLERSAHPRSVASAASPPAAAAQPSVAEYPSPQERAAGTRAVEAAPPAADAPVSVNELLQESRRLDRARTALRAGEPAHALRLLRDGAPGTTALAQEREALTIEAQAAIPALRPAAVERARAFLRAYPGSPYRARIKAVVSDGE